MNTTQEIDIDAALGYCDEEAIDNIDWPKTEEQQEMPTELNIDYAPAPPSKPKKGFFNFGGKKKRQADAAAEVSYYVDESPAPGQELENEVKEVKKSGFFKFKGKQAKEHKVEEAGHEEQFIEESRQVPVEHESTEVSQTKSSFFKFKSKKSKERKSREYHEEEPFDDPRKIPVESEVHEHTGFKKESENIHYVESANDVPEEDRGDHQEDINTSASDFNHVSIEVEEPHKPRFFNFKSKSKEREPKVTRQVPIQMETSIENEHDTSNESKPKTPPSFFNFKGKTKAKEVFNESTEGTDDDMNKTDEAQKPSFFNFKNKSSKPRQVPIEIEPTEPVSDLNEDPKEIVEPVEAIEKVVENSQPSIDEPETEPSVREQETESELGPIKEELPSFSHGPPSIVQDKSRPTKKKGLSGFFKPKKSHSSLPKPIGTMQPVDVSHLVDDDEVAHDIEVPSNQPQEDNHSTGQVPDRSRSRRKSGGLSSLFASRPSSQGRENFARNDRRSRSLPRPSKREPQDQVSKPQPQPRPQQRPPPPKSKSLFSLQPRQPRRPQGPPPGPPPAEPPPPTEIVQSHNETNNSSRAASRTGSVSSLASSKRRETKGLSNFLGTNPLRKSNRMPRSQTFPRVPQPNGQVQHNTESSDQISVQPPIQSSNPKETLTHLDHEEADRIEVAPEEKAPPQTPEVRPQEELPSRSGQAKVMGRRSGRFRKSPGGGGSDMPSQLPRGPHKVPQPEAKVDPTEQSVARDLFAQAVNRPAASAKPPLPGQSVQSVPYNDNEYDQAVNKVHRNDSYKQSAPVNQMRNYNSLPRLGNRQRDNPRGGIRTSSEQVNDRDPDTRSLDGRRRQRRGQKNDCQMM